MGSESRVNRVDVVAAPPLPEEGKLILGTPSGPGNPTLSADSRCLYRDGVPWIGVMGEIHYSRVDPAHWRASLEKMKAGGLDVVASYVFWIHHEECEGEFDWTGCRNLRGFVQACKEVGLPVVVRMGPWCHGEVRNGGLPDWILNKGFEPRGNDPKYLHYARRLYSEIAGQLAGLLWKDGGPVLGVQIENEYPGPGEHLVALYDIAREVGIDVPLYTRTGWPSPSTPVPFGYLFPLYGAYAEGFWDRSLDSMPGTYWKAFAFEKMRTDVQIGFDQLGERDEKDDADTPQYPYLTCEVGGGMEMSYHRRVLIRPMDIYSVVLTKLGSGSNLPGYYMYHGGTNPAGRLSTLHETQATKYWNDVPEKSYDFQAPLGQYGQVREQYYLLRRLHRFLHDFGPDLALMRSHLPESRPTGKTDLDTLRWAVRTDGHRGYVFINNHQRAANMPAKPGSVLEINLPTGLIRHELDVPAGGEGGKGGGSFLLPFNLKLGTGGAVLEWATAQPLSKSDHRITFFAIPGLRADFLIDGTWHRDVQPSPKPFATIDGIELVLLDEETSLAREWREVPALSNHPDNKVHVRQVQPAAPRDSIRIGAQGVAEAPAPEEYARGAIYNLTLPDNLPPDTLLRVHYLGDTARAYAQDQLLTDSFYSGRPFDILPPPSIREIQLRILPWVASAPISIDASVRPHLTHGIAQIHHVELLRIERCP